MVSLVFIAFRLVQRRALLQCVLNVNLLHIYRREYDADADAGAMVQMITAIVTCASYNVSIDLALTLSRVRARTHATEIFFVLHFINNSISTCRIT